MGTSNFMGECETRRIQEGNGVTVRELVGRLEENEVVELAVEVREERVVDQYRLYEKVERGEEEVVYVVSSMPVEPERIQTIGTIHRSSKHVSKDAHPHHTSPPADKILALKTSFLRRYSPLLSTLRSLLLLSSTFLLLLLTSYFTTVIRTRTS